jgi:predicted glutamine amidotransferase
VRAASETSVISEQNCHPFRFGRLLFQHNGHIEQFQKIKRRLNSVLRDDVYDWCGSESGPGATLPSTRKGRTQRGVPRV